MKNVAFYVSEKIVLNILQEESINSRDLQTQIVYTFMSLQLATIAFIRSPE